MDNRANYKIIYDIIKEEIINETFPFGALLPTEQMLADKYKVSRPTIAKVYNQLQEEGFIIKKKGFGTQIVYSQPNSIYTFGLLLPGAGESEIFSLINDRLLSESKKGMFNCLWEGATASSAEIRKSLIETCCDNYIKKNVDGILFSPLERVTNAEKINLRICKAISEAHIPLVLIDRDIVKAPERSEYDLICIDNFNAGGIMGRHLIESGCEVIHFFYRPNSANSVDLRLSGIRDLVLKNGLTFTEANVYQGEPSDIEFVKQIKIVPGKTGIICANDSTAAVLISSLDAIGVKISSDVLICGYDNMKYSEHLKHSLTSYMQPCEEIANVSIELLKRRIKNKNLLPMKVNLTGEMIVRESSRFHL
jgi:DNA-binding LacI/PurR family transcriptional regulator